MLNIRYILRLFTAFFVRFRLLILISIGLGFLTFFIAKLFMPIIMGKSVARIGVPGRFTTSSLPGFIVQKIGNGLTKLDASGNVEPDLATTWETADNGKTWTFHLKDATWQNGKKVNSQDVNYQFSDVTIEKPDNRTIVFKLQNPYSAFPSVVSKPAFKSGLLGTGEWEVKKLILAGTYVDQITLQNKEKDKIVYKFYPTEEKAILAYQLGQVDELVQVLNPSPLDKWIRIKLDKKVNTGEYVAVFFNNQDKLLGGENKNIRQALSYAINKDALDTTRALGPISIDSWAYNPQVKPYTYDFEKAKGIIDDYKKESKLDTIEINLTTPPVLLPQAEKIVADWQAVGLKVNLQVMANVASDYQALLAIFDLPDDPDQYSMWHSTQTATNLTHYDDKRIDKLLEDGRAQINLEDRRKTYLDFQRYLLEDAPAAFLYYPTTYSIKRR